MRPSLFGSLLALLGVSIVAAARATDPVGAPADRFLAYKTKATKGAAKPAPILGVRLVDRFEARRVDIVQPLDLLVPAAANGAGIADAVTHLQAYAIKYAKACSDDGRLCAKAAECNAGAKCKKPAHAKQLGIPQVDTFGLHAIDTVKPELLLVPSLKSLTTTPPTPNPASHAVDHYRCYKAKLAKGSPSLPKGTQVTLGDQLTAPPKAFALGKLLHLCVPVDKNGEGVIDADGNLLCWAAKPAKGEPKHAKRTGIGVNNQFGPLARDTAGERALCVPATAPGAMPTAGTTPTPAPTVAATPLDVWQPGTVPYDPTCSRGCVQIEQSASLPHLGTDVRFLYDAAIDDPIAQWADCLASMLRCFREGGGVRTCAAGAACPQECKDLFAARAPAGANDLALLPVLNGVYVDRTAPCRPLEARP